MVSPIASVENLIFDILNENRALTDLQCSSPTIIVSKRFLNPIKLKYRKYMLNQKPGSRVSIYEGRQGEKGQGCRRSQHSAGRGGRHQYVIMNSLSS